MKNISLERINKIADHGTFIPFEPIKGASFHLGTIKIAGRKTYILATDIDTPPAISPFQAISRQTAFLKTIVDDPAPLIQLLDIPPHMKKAKGKTPLPNNGMQLLASPNGIGGTYALLASLSGLVPRISVLFGPIAATLSFPAVLADATVMCEDASLTIGRPDAVELMIGEKTTYEKLGGAKIHHTVTGIASHVTASEGAALSWTKNWLSYLPVNNQKPLPSFPSKEPLNNILTVAANIEQTNINSGINIDQLIKAVADLNSWFETGSGFARECLTGLCRIEGKTAAIIAGNSKCRGGILFPETCRKLTRFIQFCSSFAIPVIFMADTPGFMVGEVAEHDGNVQAAADLYTAITKSTSTKICLVVRKAYSAGLYAMAGAAFDAHFWAMPSASISIFGPKALERFSEDREMPESSRQAAAEMLQGAKHPEKLVELNLVEKIIKWEELRQNISTVLK